MSPDSTPKRKKVMLIIMDGLGAAPNSKGNAVTLAQPKNLIKLWDSYPHTYLDASGESVGLPEGTYGNSEVGHLNIGAGKIILQNLPKINRSIEKGAYYSNQTLIKAYDHVIKYGSKVHIMGCISDGSVHSHVDHFVATHQFFVNKGYTGKLYFHGFTDGRDTAPQSAPQYLLKLQEQINKTGLGHIATLIGRSLAMDRNQKWERTEKAYSLLTKGAGTKVNDWLSGVNSSYAAGITDEFIEPMIIPDRSEIPMIAENDAVIFLNFRADRAIQLSEAFISPEFLHFQRLSFQNLMFVAMVPYRKDFPTDVIMPKEYVNLSLGRMLSEQNLRQLRIAESEKFPHVTYFFNGGLGVKYPGEDRIEIQSPNVPTYDLKPEMSAMEITQALEERIKTDTYDFILVNLANPDMVGHTGNMDACIKSVQVTDYCIGRLVSRFTATGGTVILTADHGNVEEVIKYGTEDVIDTEHSLNPVPFIVVGGKHAISNMKYGKLSDIAPTVLQILGLNKPDEMRGNSLIG